MDKKNRTINLPFRFRHYIGAERYLLAILSGKNPTSQILIKTHNFGIIPKA